MPPLISDNTGMDITVIVFIGLAVIILGFLAKIILTGQNTKQEVANLADLHPDQIAYLNTWEQNPHKDRIHGLPGAGLIEAFGQNGVTGMKGEIATAARLNEVIEKYPNLHVFHGVHYKGSRGDIDHVFLMGKTIILVDSKKWENNKTYKLTRNGQEKLTATKDGATFSGGSISLPLVTSMVRKDHPAYETFGVLSVETHGGRIYENIQDNRIGFVRADSLPLRLDRLLSKAEASDSKAVKAMSSYVVKLPVT